MSGEVVKEDERSVMCDHGEVLYTFNRHNPRKESCMALKLAHTH
jgi:hypothetical protein